jgi:predicted unusual protein kinase regulating ubiquinone biosynthesis (AarF/ABC1/UbiB family)
MTPDDGAAKRALRMAAMSAGVSGSYIGYMVQRLFLSEEARDEKLRATHARAARQVTGGLLSLRGPAMKLGQMLSLQTDLLPEEMIAELGRLQMEAPGMHPSLVRAQFRSSMGSSPEQMFAHFDATPFAAASLGQVHRAVTRRGEEVAVKIQYPGIGDAIASDFRLLRTMTLPARLSRYLPPELLDELQTQIAAETDYVREAENIDFFRTGLEPLGFVSVPEVHREYSGERVLTMSRIPGEHLDAILARDPPQELRDRIGANLLELYYFQLLHMQAFHADPHWGNYLFRDDGSIGLVDFGCVKYVPPKFVENLRKIFLYPGPRDAEEFRRLLDERYSLYGKRLGAASMRALVQFSERFYGRVYPPGIERDDEPFDFSDPAFLRDYMTHSLRVTRARGALPEYVFLARAEAGLYQTLHRLGARVRTSQIVRRYLDGADQT